MSYPRLKTVPYPYSFAFHRPSLCPSCICIFYEERQNHRTVYMTNEFHLNAHGNQVVAEELAHFLTTYKPAP